VLKSRSLLSVFSDVTSVEI